MTTPTALDISYRVVDLSQGIAGAYCTKVLADAGAEVIMVEPPSGSPLRRRSASGVPTDPDSAAGRSLVERLISSADVVVWGEESSLCRDQRLSVERLRALAPRATVLALSGYGLTSPWMGRPNNEFIWQSLSGAAWNHGSSDGTPIMIGGSHGDYSHGTLGAVGILMAKARAERSGGGELVDVAALEVLQLTHNLYPITFFDTAGRPHRPFRTDPIPSVHPTKDGWIGLWVTTG
jgi:crotonobetainyl-CoA:carnitine CoA-transferase CaiB-like acyl-CoA transferase